MHNINTFISREAAWHHLGTTTGKYQTTDELLRDPGFQYVVFKSQLRDGLGRPVEAYGTFRWNLSDKVNGNKDAAQFLGTVGKDYAVMQHDEGFKSIDALMSSAPDAKYETAGVLGDGERVWALADLGLSAKIGDDVQKGYLLFSTGHDGSLAHSYRICMTRVVCQNTLSAALGEKTKASLTIRHTKNAMGRLIDARAALEGLGSDVKRVEDKLNFLAGRKCNREAVTAVFDRLFPKTRKDDDREVSSTRRDNIIADILKIYELNDGNAFPEQRGTLYAMLNSVTNYTDHERSTKEDGRAQSAMFGSGDTLKTKAMEVIMDVARACETVPTRQYFTAADRSEHDEVMAGLLAAK
jgi:phage/plasmid-like protein (TIGR03299 family)